MPIPSLYTHLIAAGAALAIGASGAAWMQAQRYGLQISKLEHAATSKDLRGANQAVQDMAGFQKGFNDALTTFQAAQQRNAVAQLGLDSTLRDLRAFTGGLRGDFAGLPAKLERATATSASEYITACTAVFESMAVAGGRMAEGGAEIARKAAGHAADARLMQDAWPRAKPANIP